MKKEKPTVRMTNARFAINGGFVSLTGICKDHPRLGDEEIVTSPIIEIKKAVVETLNTIYVIEDEDDLPNEMP